MRVQLEGIKFNHDPDDLKKTGAFNLRRNETQLVTVPEWLPSVSPTFEASPAAYAKSYLPQEMTIQASFKCESGLNTPLMVRAIAEPPNHVLGNIEPQEIPNTPSTGFLPLKLANARVSSVGVGIHDIAWRWQFSDQPDVWTDFQTTFHRIYTVLELPSEPWKPECPKDSNIHQPWTEVLNYACLWAQGVTSDLDVAATRITKNFFDLGKTLLRYDSGGFYAFETFDCTKFLTLLNTGVGAQTVNCDDCATVVSTFANILGCQLSQSGLGQFFSTNPIVLIGTDDFVSKDFIYHSVAWKGQATENDAVFDGCLKIDADVAPPLIPEQPVDLPFGTMTMGYRFSLVNGAPHVTPIPDHPDFGRRRRKLGSGYLGQLRITDQEVINNLKKRYEFDSWPEPKEEPPQPPEVHHGIAGILKLKPFVKEWLSHFGERFQDQRFPSVFQLLLKPANEVKNQLLGVNVYECKSANDANENLIELLGRFEQLKFRRLTEPPVGDVAFADKHTTIVLFRSGRWLLVLRSAGRIPFSVKHFISVITKGFGPAVSK